MYVFPLTKHTQLPLALVGVQFQAKQILMAHINYNARKFRPITKLSPFEDGNTSKPILKFNQKQMLAIVPDQIHTEVMLPEQNCC